MTEQIFPTSFAQQRLWFVDQLNPGTSAYNLPRAFRLTGSLHTENLHKSLQSIIFRHSSLRTIFTSVEGEPSQIVLDALELELPLMDLSPLTTAEKQETVSRILGEQARQAFDLSTGPLFRAMLLRLGPSDHIFLLVMHHIITDGWSMSVLLRELGVVYSSLSAGRQEQLAELPLQYSDFSRWQREEIARDVLADQLNYWKNKLLGAETVLSLSTNHPRANFHDGFGKAFHFRLPHGLDEKLKSLARGESATLFMALLTVFQILLWRYTSQDSILIGIPTAGRNDADLDNLVGLFVNTLVLRGDLSPDLTFRQLLAQARTNTLEALDQQDVPFEKLVEALEPVRSIHRNPLFQVMFIFQNTPKQRLKFPGLLVEEIEFESGIAKAGLSLEIIELDGLYCTFEFESNLYDDATIARMAVHFTTLLEGVIEAPDEKISGLPLLSPAEVKQIAQWNNTGSEFPSDLCIHTAFEKQAGLTPDTVAIIEGEKRLNYRELNHRATLLARRLASEGVHPGVLVGIALPPSSEMVIALLAVFKTGAAYLPLDLNQPEHRLGFMVDDSQATVVVTLAEFAGLFRNHPVGIVTLDDTTFVARQQELADPSLAVSSASLAYVIYTSGSTGTPKGVQGTHRASLNRFAWMWKRFPFIEGETCCQKTPLGFVDSVWEIFGPLLRGIPAVIIPQESVIDPEQFVHLLAKYEVTRIVLIPSLLQIILEQCQGLQNRLPRLKLWTCSGEVLPVALARLFAEAMPDATLLNIYGSSEVAADVTWHVTTSQDGVESIPIGRPISNVQLHLLDRYRNQVPQGVPGEVFVGGECLSTGYWRRPELTAERFLQHSFTPNRFVRLFRTGDLARYLPDGEIEYIGRADNQVKIRGSRVELGEIEAVLSLHRTVMDAVVLLAGAPAHEKLVAYVVVHPGAEPKTDELRRFLKSKLPEYMVPSQYLVIDVLPLLPSGKIDRKTLAAQTSIRSLDERRYIAPQTATQEALAAIWRELLKVDQVGINENFFELGGHSLMVMQVIARIRKVLEVEVPLRNMFENPTIEGLADEVESARASGIQARTPILSSRTVAAATSKRTIMAQLNQLSEGELHELLKQVLKDKQAV